MRFHDQGLLSSYSEQEGLEVIELLKAKNFNYRHGPLDTRGEQSIYSPSMDRQLGHWGTRRKHGTKYHTEKCFYLNPSLLHHLPPQYQQAELDGITTWPSYMQKATIKPLVQVLANIANR